MTYWGSAHNSNQHTTATINGTPVELEIAVNDDEDIRIAAWSADHTINIEIVVTTTTATVIRDVLHTAITEGRWLV